MNLVVYLYKKMLGAKDIREIVQRDFLQLSPSYEEYAELLIKNISSERLKNLNDSADY